MGQIGNKDEKPGGLAIYYENNTVEFLSGSAVALANKWRASRRSGIVCLKVFFMMQYNIWEKEPGESGRALQIYNYSREKVGTDFYWYDAAEDKYERGNLIPPGIPAEDRATGKLVTNDYFNEVYNIALIHARKPTGPNTEEEISPLLPTQVSASFDGVLV